jgi:hypothetical protein
MADLDTGFFPSRWDCARKDTRSYLRDGKSRRQRVIHHRDCPPPQHQIEQSGNCTCASTAKGLIYSPDYGKVAFTVPGMPEYIRPPAQPLTGQQLPHIDLKREQLTTDPPPTGRGKNLNHHPAKGYLGPHGATEAVPVRLS